MESLELDKFFAKPRPWIAGWDIEQQARELGQYALEAGYGDLPELDIGEGGVPQHEFDVAVEEAYSWLTGEARRFLEGKTQ